VNTGLRAFSEIEDMEKFILTINPSEIIFDIKFPEKESVTTLLEQSMQCLVSVNEAPIDPALFVAQSCKIQTVASFGKALEE